MKKKVLFFIKNSKPGGTEQIFNQLIKEKNEFIEAGIDLCIATYKNNPGVKYYYNEGREFKYLDIVNPLDTLADACRMNRECLKDNIFFHYKIICYKLLNIFSGFYNIPRIKKFIADEKIDAVYIVEGGFQGGIGLDILKAAKCKKIDERIWVLHSYPLKSKTIREKIQEQTVKSRAEKYVSEIITVSEFCKKGIKNNTKIKKGISVIYNGLEKCDHMTKQEKAEELQVREDADFYIGMIANFISNKGHMCVLKALKYLVYEKQMKIQLIIIGNALELEYYTDIKKYIRDEGLEDYVSIKEGIFNAGKYTECFDVVVVPSLEVESFGLVSLEAMMYSVPVIAHEMGGIPEVVLHEKNGFLIEVGNIEELCYKIKYLYDYPEIRKKMGNVGYKIWNQNFTAKVMCKKYIDYMRSYQS